MHHIPIENRLLAYLVFVLSAMTQLPAMAQNANSDDCSCSPSHVSSNYAVAERIFEGRILNGRLDDESDSIIFEVGEISTVRGEEQSPIRLSTSLSQGCSVDIYAGSEMVFILGAGDKSVSRCDVPFGYHNKDARRLMKALKFIEHYETNRAKAQSVLVDNLVVGADASALRSILNIAYRLDPTEPVFDTSTVLVYRDLEVNVKNDRVVSYVWR